MAGSTGFNSVQYSWQSQDDFQSCTRQVGIHVTTDGVRLAPSVMIQDELGRTHNDNIQTLTASTQARKDFLLTAADVADGTLYFYDSTQRSSGRTDVSVSATTRVELNGQRLQPIRHLPSTGWRMVRVPATALQPGVNSFVFSGSGGLLVEDSMYPNRSACSTDGGRTWDYDAMGPQGMNDGEFLVRLRLNRNPERAILTSPVVDLALLAAEKGLLPQFDRATVNLQAEMDQPPDTAIIVEARCSSDGELWTPWQEASRAFAGDTLPRYLQWRAALSSLSGQATPVLKSVRLVAELQLAADQRLSGVTVVENTPVSSVRSSYRFAFEQPHTRLELLRKQYDLKKVVSGHRREWDRLVALRNWCRHSAPKGWDSGRTQWCPPWDALVILETNKTPLALCMCTHYSTLFVQTAAALGYVARHVILDHHCVAEVWSNELRKWVLMDTGNSENPAHNCHFEHDGMPLSALELRRLWKQGKASEVWAVYLSGEPERIIDGDKPLRSCADPKLYRRFGMAMRNNHLLTPFPGELTQGEGAYFCDAYLWWEDGPVPVESPEYGLASNREDDFYWSVNETAIELYESTEEMEIGVILRSDTPNFAVFEVKLDRCRWHKHSSEFIWKLKPGRNSLQARSVNSFGVRGPVSRAVVDVTS